MRTVALETVLRGVWALFTGVSELPPADDYPTALGFIDLALQESWEAADWPELVTEEERTPVEDVVSLDQADETPIGEVFLVTLQSSRGNPAYREARWRLTNEGIQLLEPTTTVWVEFRLRRPTLTGAALDTDLAHAEGSQVYFTPTGGLGNLYTALEANSAGQTPETHPDQWAVVEIPAILQSYLTWSAYSKMQESDGQGDKAAVSLGMAQRYLALEADKLFRQQQQQERPLRLRTY